MLTSSTEQPKRRKLLAGVALALVALGVLAWPAMEWFGQTADRLVASRAAAQDPSTADAGAVEVEVEPATGDGARNPAGGKMPHQADMADLYLPRPSKAEQEILRTLSSPTDLDFIETPLEDVLNNLQERHKVQFFIERSALDEEGVNPDAPVTFSLKAIPLEVVLKLLLEPLQLTFVIEDELLKVTTMTKAGEKLITRTYPVSDLLPKRGKRQADSPRPAGASPAAAPETSDGKPAAAGDSVKPGNFMFGSTATWPKSRDARVESDLLRAITQTVEPESWSDIGGPGTIVYVEESGSFVIRQTRQTHQAIVELLRALRDAKALHLSRSGKE